MALLPLDINDQVAPPSGLTQNDTLVCSDDDNDDVDIRDDG